MGANRLTRLSRRDLLRLCAATSAGLLLEACAPAVQQAKRDRGAAPETAGWRTTVCMTLSETR
jgi:hypothetical protein